MKTQILILTLMSVVLVNCGAKGSSDSGGDTAAPTVVVPPGSSPYTPPVNGPGQGPGPGFTYGGTTNFLFDSKGIYSQYTLRTIQDLSQLSNVKINLNLDRYNNTFGGTVTIRYNYNGATYEGFFTSGNSPETNKYNIWFTSGGLPVWHGFFEDFRGAIIVVIDDATSLLDGVHPQDTVSGSVWFKNFAIDPNPHPATYCWFIYNKPSYDCRAWKSGNGVNTTAALYPDSGYTRLGTFKNIPVTSSFNGLTQL